MIVNLTTKMIKFVVIIFSSLIVCILSQSYVGPFTIQNFQLPDGNLLFHDIFVSEEKSIVFVAAPGFGLIRNSTVYKTMDATAW